MIKDIPWEPLRRRMDNLAIDALLARGTHASAYYENQYVAVILFTGIPTTNGPAEKIILEQIKPNKAHLWKQMQYAKNELFGEDAWAVQYFPPQNELVDLRDAYWVFVFPPGILPVPCFEEIRPDPNDYEYIPV